MMENSLETIHISIGKENNGEIRADPGFDPVFPRSILPLSLERWTLRKPCAVYFGQRYEGGRDDTILDGRNLKGFKRLAARSSEHHMKWERGGSQRWRIRMGTTFN
jgi:hypothetical protein